jgi:alpha-ketoglutarate-dependent taurine dioxygenase
MSAPLLEDFIAAVGAGLPTFDDAPAAPVEVDLSATLDMSCMDSIVERYHRYGYAVVQARNDMDPKAAILSLATQLRMGEPFVPPLYTKNGYRSEPLARISRESGGAKSHPSFERATALPFHCDGTLQPIGMVKVAALFCASAAASGGETILFNAAAAFARLLDDDPDAALALANPGVLVRQANVNGSSECNRGPAFCVEDSWLVSGYSVADTDRWDYEAAPDRAALARAVAYLSEASRPGSEHFLVFRLEAGQIIVMSNCRIAHGRLEYTDAAAKRVLHRGLFLQHPTCAGARS